MKQRSYWAPPKLVLQEQLLEKVSKICEKNLLWYLFQRELRINNSGFENFIQWVIWKALKHLLHLADLLYNSSFISSTITKKHFLS